MAEMIRKAQPTPSDAHVNKPLTNISVAYIQTQGFVADRVFPVVPVENQSDLYYTFTKDDFWRDEAAVRAPGTESAGGGFGVSTTSYRCSVKAYHKDVSDQLRANADSVLQLDTAATQFVTQKMMISRERTWSTAYFTTGVWTTDITGVASAPSAGQTIQWDAATGSAPRADVDTGKTKIAQATGFLPNKLVIGLPVLLKLRSNADIRDQYKYTSANSIDAAMLANYFGVDELVVSSAVYSTTVEGAASPATAFINGKNALLCFSAPAPSLMQPTAGYIFSWSGLLGAGQGGIRIKRFRMEQLASDRIEAEMSYDMKVVAPDLGYFFSAIVS